MTDSQLPNVPPQPTAPARVSNMAVCATILGIIAIPLTVLGVGLIFGVVAVATGIIAWVMIDREPQERAGIGLAKIGIVGGVVTILLAILAPALQGEKSHENHGSSCAANITGTVKGFIVYANENNDCFPIAGLPTSDKAYSPALGVLSTATDPDTALAQMQTAPGAQGNPLSALWMLVLRQQETPKSLICKSDSYASSTPSPTMKGNIYLLSPMEQGQISYSIAYPYASATKVGDWWKNTTQPDLPVITDMAPLNGTGRPRRNLAATGTPKDLKMVNSGNHNGDGQNVGFADAHCEWRTNPLAGQSGDDIWTVGTVTPPSGTYGGSLITAGGVPNYPPTATMPFDTIMVPVRNLETGAIK